MDNKVIAVWGNGGSGKSVISLAVANMLTKKDKSVVVINTDKVTPMLRIYLPYLEEIYDTPETSAAPLYSGNINNVQFKRSLHTHPKNSNLGFLALGSHDDVLIYQDNWSNDTINQLVGFIFRLDIVDYIIFDCSCDIFSDNGSLYAIKRADHIIRVTSPDNRGYTYTKTQLRIMTGGDFGVDRNITILNNAHPYSPVEELLADWKYDYILPHSFSVQNNYIAGDLLSGFTDDIGYTFECEVKNIVERIIQHE